MTNEEAYNILQSYLDFKGFVLYPDEKFYEAIELATLALNAVDDPVPSHYMGCFNCIHVLKKITENPCMDCDNNYNKWEGEDNGKL